MSSCRACTVRPTAARRWTRRFRLAEWDGVEYEVVGVSSDYKVRFPTEEPASYLHLAASQRLRTGAVILARTRGDAASLSADIRRELAPVDPLVWGSVLLLLVAVCTAAFAGPARRMVKLDVPRALRMD